ncbi:hypothetical protein V8C86DRAFT_2856556 [Haematococcus lacustris]
MGSGTEAEMGRAPGYTSWLCLLAALPAFLWLHCCIAAPPATFCLFAVAVASLLWLVANAMVDG